MEMGSATSSPDSIFPTVGGVAVDVIFVSLMANVVMLLLLSVILNYYLIVDVTTTTLALR